MLRFSMTVPIDAFCVWMTGVSATTGTTSVSWPISSVNGKRFALPTCTWMFDRSSCRESLELDLERVGAGGTAGKTYTPDSLVWARRTAFVAALVSVTLTPGSTDPLESVTSPLISPDGVCADAGSASARRRNRPNRNRLRIQTSKNLERR